MKISKLFIRGEKLKINNQADSPDEILKLDRTYIITPATRGSDQKETVTIADDEVIEFVFEDQTTWLCNNETIDELFPGSLVLDRGGNAEFELPVTISSDDPERGLGDVVMKAVNIFKNKIAGKAIESAVKKLADKLEDKLMGNFEGWFRLDSNFSFLSTTTIDQTKPILLFLHGTAASAESSFKDLMGTDLWKFIHENYGHNVTAFQHRTLSRFPFENVLSLIKSLPSHATIHIISQSGGGLVGELLSRFTNSDENRRGLTKVEMEALEKEYPKTIFKKEIESVVEDILKEVKKKKIIVERSIRVACPAGGSILASKRLDFFMNMLMNVIGNAFGSVANPIYLAVKNLVGGVINCKNDPELLPGVEVLNPKSGFMKALNNRHDTIALENSLTVISGNAKIKFNLKSLLILASKLFYLQDNDLIVNTKSMYRGTKRTGLAQYFLQRVMM